MSESCAHRLFPDGLPSADEVVVWLIDLDIPADERARLHDALAPAERDRAERFASAQLRDRYIVARGRLRCVLGACLDREPAEVGIIAGRYGKPELADRAAGSDWCFNVSHSFDKGLIAIARAREVGVDLECVRADTPVEQIADVAFSPREAAVLRALPSETRKSTFFQWWTRKEAYLKARGIGLLDDLREVGVPPPRSASATSAVGWLTGTEASAWSVEDLPVGPRFAAALAAAGADWRFTFRAWPAMAASTAIDGAEVHAHLTPRHCTER
jgi:4'-phosphopantetheinyl transferase